MCMVLKHTRCFQSFLAAIVCVSFVSWQPSVWMHANQRHTSTCHALYPLLLLLLLLLHTGISINWSCQLPVMSALLSQAKGRKQSTPASAGVHEVTTAAFGRKQGAARKGPAATSIKTRSRLSSAALFEQWQQLLEMVPCLQQGTDTPVDRTQAKQVAGAAYTSAWGRLRAGGAGAGSGVLFTGWLPKPDKQF